MTGHQYKDFPPGWGHIKVPMSSRRAALAGLGLYSACRARALWTQRAAGLVAAIFGPGALWGRSFAWSPMMTAAEWEELASLWRGELGTFDDMAGYSRLQASRGGLALLLLRKGAPIAFVKLRQGDAAELANEWRALTAVEQYRPRAFQAPAPLRFGSVGGWNWLAAAPLPSGLHRPSQRPPLPEILGEIAAALAGSHRPLGTPDHWRPMHGDFAPWNLRQLRGKSLALVDWEQAGWAPPAADEVFYQATSAVLGRGLPGHCDAAEAIRYWRDRISLPENPRDERLRAGLRDILGRMEERCRGRMKVLVSAYACEPERGSEPGVGWNLATQAARHHEVWVVTRANNRRVIEDALTRNPVPGLNVVYHDLPRWMRWWKRGASGTRLYYYLWQLTLYPVVRRLQRHVRFDVTHHATFVKYAAPSPLALLPVPFLWGPVGGGEEAPKPLLAGSGWRGRVYELIRTTARWIGEHDPLVLATARGSGLALATTEQTAIRMRAIGAQRVEILSQLGLTAAERASLADLAPPPPEPLRFLSLGNLLHWKGFHLGLRAFAAAGISGAEYWLIGDGSDRKRLSSLAAKLGIADRVHFWGVLPRTDALRQLGCCHVVVHPSMHDSGALACVEAMAAGRPVICLDVGGPARLVTPEAGFKIAAGEPDRVVRDIAEAMLTLADNPALRTRMGQAARDRVALACNWEDRGRVMSDLYRRIARAAR
jgi:glycosyltransferase involved in cell wall biosynthesis